MQRTEQGPPAEMSPESIIGQIRQLLELERNEEAEATLTRNLPRLQALASTEAVVGIILQVVTGEVQRSKVNSNYGARGMSSVAEGLPQPQITTEKKNIVIEKVRSLIALRTPQAYLIAEALIDLIFTPFTRENEDLKTLVSRARSGLGAQSE